jgi:hypothetical protein
MKMNVEEVAAKLLESAIWMYAYDYDETAVHLVAAASFEQYTKRLDLGSMRKELEEIVGKDKKKFWSQFNKTYTFFKHGEYRRKPLEEIDYNPVEVEDIILMACEANLTKESKYKLECAVLFTLYMALKRPDLFKDEFKKFAEESKKDLGALGIKEVNRKTLEYMLNTIKNPLVERRQASK